MWPKQILSKLNRFQKKGLKMSLSLKKHTMPYPNSSRYLYESHCR